MLSDGRRVGEALAADAWIEDDLLRPVFDRDVNGLPRHRLVYLEVPRGHWKSGGAAAVAIAEAFLGHSTDVVVAAADRDQAGIIGENISGYLHRNATLRASVRAKADEFLIPARDSRIRIIASDEPGSWGLGGVRQRFRLIADELTAWPTRGEKLWIALVSATGKTPDVQTIVLSNAGTGQERSWQWRIRETARRAPWGYLFAASGVTASWIGPDWVEQMRELLPPTAFERVILNRWTSESGDFVTREQWRRCVDERWAPQPWGRAGVQYVAGVDLGLVKDRTAIAVLHRDGDEAVLDELMVFQGSRAEPVSIASVERTILDLADRFSGLRVVCDPWQFKGSVERLRGRVGVEEFQFTAGSVGRLSTSLYQSITAGRLRVFPDDELEREVLGLQVVETSSGWRFDHRAGGYSDRAVAIGMTLTYLAGRPARLGLASVGFEPGGLRTDPLSREPDALGPIRYGMDF